MSPRRITATAGRVLRQLRHDPRTIGLILFVPCLLIVLLKYVFDGQTGTFDKIGAPLLGVFPFIVMFVVTSIATLRERTSGTLERLLTMPLHRLELLLGYALAFAVMAVLQAALVTTISLTWLGLSIQGPAWELVLLAMLNGILGMSLGLFVSAFARSEFQAVQFMPAFVLPQILLCGLLVDRGQMAKLLQWLADILPLTYAVDALKLVTKGTTGHDMARDLAVVIGFTVAVLALGAVSLRRQSD